MTQIEGYLWMVSWLDGRIWTEINVLTSIMNWLGVNVWTETQFRHKILVYKSGRSKLFSFSFHSTPSIFLLQSH